MRLFFTVFLILLGSAVHAQTCEEMFQQAQISERKEEYFDAYKKYDAALTRCGNARQEEIERKKQGMVKRLEEQKGRAERAEKDAKIATQKAKKAEKDAKTLLKVVEQSKSRADSIAESNLHIARSALANSLATKSKSQLADGNLTAAFELAEFAEKCIEPGNRSVAQALADARYSHKKPSANQTHLLWNTKVLDHQQAVYDVEWAKNDSLILTVGSSAVKIWDVLTGLEVATFYDADKACISPDGSMLVIHTRFGRIQIYDVKNKNQVLSFPTGLNGSFGLNKLWISPDGTKLVCMDEHNLFIWNIRNGEKLISVESEYFGDFAWTPDGAGFVVENFDLLQFWNLKEKRLIASNKEVYAMHHLCFSPDATKIVGFSKCAQILGASTGNVLDSLCIPPIATGIEATRWISRNYLMVCRRDLTIETWNLRTKTMQGIAAGYQRKINCVAFSKGGRQLAAGDAEGYVKIWDIEKHLEDFDSYLEETDQNIDYTSLSPDGKKLLYTDSRNLYVKEISTGEEIFTYPHFRSYNTNKDAWSPDHNKIAFIGENGCLHIANLSTGVIDSFCNVKTNRNTVNWSPDGSRIAIEKDMSRYDIILFDTHTHKDIGLDAGFSSDRFLSFSPDSLKIAISGVAGGINFLDATSGKFQENILQYDDDMRYASWSPDGLMMAIADKSDNIRIIDIKYKEQTGLLIGHKQEITDIKWSPDGKKLLSSSKDGSLIVWDVSSESQILSLKESGEISSVDWFPDGAHIISGGLGHGIRFWTVSVDSIIQDIRKQWEYTPFTARDIQSLDLKSALEFSNWGGAIWDNYPAQKMEIARYFQNEGSRTNISSFFEKGYALAEQFYYQAYSNNNYLAVQNKLLTLYYDWYRKWMNLANYKEARRIVKKASELNFSERFSIHDSSLASFYGHVLLLSGRPNEAIFYYNQPSKSEKKYWIGHIKYELEMLSFPIDTFKKHLDLLEHQYKNEELLEDWQDALEELENIEYAYENEEASIDSLSEAYNYYIWLSLITKKYDQVDVSTQLAYWIDTCNLTAKRYAAHALLINGQVEKAKPIYINSTKDIDDFGYMLSDLEDLNYQDTIDFIKNYTYQWMHINAKQFTNAISEECAILQDSIIKLRDSIALGAGDTTTFIYDLAVLGTYSIYLLKPENTIAAANEAIALDSTMSSLQVILSYGYLYGGQPEKAKEILKSIKKDLDNDPAFKEMILNDFQRFSSVGVVCPFVPDLVVWLIGRPLTDKELKKYKGESID